MEQGTVADFLSGEREIARENESENGNENVANKQDVPKWEKFKAGDLIVDSKNEVVIVVLEVSELLGNTLD